MEDSHASIVITQTEYGIVAKYDTLADRGLVSIKPCSLTPLRYWKDIIELLHSSDRRVLAVLNGMS